MAKQSLTAQDLMALVQASRRRTLELVRDLPDAQLAVPLLEHVNPFLWELGHVAFFYEAFLLQELDGGELLMPHGHELYNSFEVAHDDRWVLGLPDRAGTLEYMDVIAERVQRRLTDRQPTPQEEYLYLLAVQHEDMHAEAFTYMRQCLGLPAPPAVIEGRRVPRAGAGALPGDVAIPGGTYLLGARDDGSFAYDNEKWAHEVELPAFEIARAPVTCAEFLEFVEDGGYTREELWSFPGWKWRERGSVTHPDCWVRDGDSWAQRHYDARVPLDPHHPVSHISWFEAMAYCAWAGRRLPSEAEWELAASGTSSDRNAKRRFPWGDQAPTPELANLGTGRGGCLDVAEFPAGESDFGCRQMVGNVWEWTTSEFYPFPGYILDQPYKEYSAPWFGDRKVLRGGSWATQPSLGYCVYRNFFQPHRRDLFAGFRTCAKG